ncbi:MAG: hypothetical protein JWN67_1229 [Actinomycetia bacterium]|nr:hypothetical protein [Actinomycetes bacterium]
MMRIPPFRSALAGILAFAALATGAAVADGATPTPPATPVTPAPAFAESFTSPTWFQSWGRAGNPWHSTVATEGANRFLRVSIAKGAHDGTSFFKYTGEHDAVTLRYRIRFGAGWDPSKSSHNIKLPGFGAPLLDPQGVCLAGCGGAGADGVRGYSARVDVQDTGVPGFYVYDVNPILLAYGTGMRWSTPTFQPGRWYTVQVSIAMNTPGRSDGVLRASVDGRPVFARDDLLFRLTPLLHVGAAWFDFYYGGAGVAPNDTTIDVDDIALFAGVL